MKPHQVYVKAKPAIQKLIALAAVVIAIILDDEFVVFD